MSLEPQPLRLPRSHRSAAAVLAALAATSLASAAPQVWADQIGTGLGEQVYGIASDGAGGSYETGSTLGDLGGAQLGNGDAFVTRRDPAGDVTEAALTRIKILPLNLPHGFRRNSNYI